MATALGNRLSVCINDDTGPGIVGIVIVTDAVDANHIALIFDGTGSGQQVPRRLTGFRPVGDDDNSVVLTTSSIAAPTRKAQVITGQQEQAEPGIADNSMFLTWSIIAVFVTIGKEVVFVIIGNGI